MNFQQGYALFIGIANYFNVSPLLTPSVAKDVEDLRMLFINPVRCGYHPCQARYLTDRQATANAIRKSFRWLAEETREDSTVVIYLAGHGVQITDGPFAGNYLLPVDATPQNFPLTTIREDEFTEMLGNIRARHQLIILDCRRSTHKGTIKGFLDETKVQFVPGFDETLYDRLVTREGRAVIATCQSTEIAWTLPDMQNSLFAYYLQAALRGGVGHYGDDPPGISEIFRYVSRRLALQRPDQHPLLKVNGGLDFPITGPAIFSSSRRQRMPEFVAAPC
jgi:hypothetical protein